MNLLTNEQKELLKNNCVFRMSLKDQSTKELVAYLVNHNLVTNDSSDRPDERLSDTPVERLSAGFLHGRLQEGFTLTFISRDTDNVFHGEDCNDEIGWPRVRHPHPYLGDICIDGTYIRIPVGQPETQLAYHIRNKFLSLGRSLESEINGELRWGIGKDEYLIPLDTLPGIDVEPGLKAVLVARTPTKEKFRRDLELKGFTIRQLCKAFAEDDKHRKSSELCLTGDEYYIAFKQLVRDGWIFINKPDPKLRWGPRVGVGDDWSLQHLFIRPHFPVNTINKEAELRAEIASTTYFRQRWDEATEEREHYKRRNSELEAVITLLEKDVSLLRQELAAHKTGAGSVDALFQSKDITFHRDMRRDFMRLLHPDKTDNPRAHEYAVFLNQLWDKLK